MNAWEDGDRIIADVMQADEAPLFPHPDGSPTDPQKSQARLCRWTFDLSGNTDRFAQVYLDDIKRRIPAHRRSPRRPRQSAWLVRLRQSALPMSRGPLRPGACRRQGDAAWPLSAAASATRSRSRSSSPAAMTRPKATAGCSPPSGARATTAATSRCSTPEMSAPARQHWCNWAIACPPVFMVTGLMRRQPRALTLF